MPSKIQNTFAGLALLLGIGHLIFSALAFKAYTAELLWFSGTGIAMIVTTLANFQPNVGGLIRLQNAVMLGFVIAIIIAAPLPQVWAALIIFSGLFLSSLMSLRKS